MRLLEKRRFLVRFACHGSLGSLVVWQAFSFFCILGKICCDGRCNFLVADGASLAAESSQEAGYAQAGGKMFLCEPAGLEFWIPADSSRCMYRVRFLFFSLWFVSLNTP